MTPFSDKVIPGGEKCNGCEFYWFAAGYYWFCSLFDTPIEDKRIEECVAALPDGGVVETVIKVAP